MQWAAHQAGVQLDRTAEAQYLQLKGMGSTISVEQALHTPGALLFHLPHEPTPGEAFGPNAHVAISLGDGRTVEAIGSKYGVREVDVASFHTGGDAFFTRAAVIPGLSDGTATPVRRRRAPTRPLPRPWRPPPTRRSAPRRPADAGGVAHVPADAPSHATPGHVVELVALPPLPGVVDHRADRVAAAAAGRRSPAPAPAGRVAAAASRRTRRPLIRPTRPTRSTRPPTPCTRPSSTPPTRPTPTPPTRSP